MTPPADTQKALIVLVDLVNRTPKSTAEMLGAQVAVSTLEAAITELNALKNPSADTPATVPFKTE